MTHTNKIRDVAVTAVADTGTTEPFLYELVTYVAIHGREQSLGVRFGHCRSISP